MAPMVRAARASQRPAVVCGLGLVALGAWLATPWSLSFDQTAAFTGVARSAGPRRPLASAAAGGYEAGAAPVRIDVYSDIA
mmetsp:Transcript_14719/g.39640  ORF Transcript_14719/g.39640 Transcript_14719/m.39640 type:complete len:81 (-) Transcript_14719:37-279(-)